jgi:hypothetical protein
MSDRAKRFGDRSKNARSFKIPGMFAQRWVPESQAGPNADRRSIFDMVAEPPLLDPNYRRSRSAPPARPSTGAQKRQRADGPICSTRVSDDDRAEDIQWDGPGDDGDDGCHDAGAPPQRPGGFLIGRVPTQKKTNEELWKGARACVYQQFYRALPARHKLVRAQVQAKVQAWPRPRTACEECAVELAQIRFITLEAVALVWVEYIRCAR